LHFVFSSDTIDCVVSLGADYFGALGGAVMARCAICDKGVHFGNNVSHSHRKTPKMWKSNVKSVRVKTEGGATKKMYVCTSCLRSGKVERA
jgi:large subunit ribosomal protein L28